MRLRPAALLVLGAGAALHLLSRTTGGGWLALASAMVLALLPVALFLRPDLDGLRAERLQQGRPAAGELGASVLVVHNAGRRTSSAAVAVDEMPRHASVRVALPALRPGERLSVPLPRRALHRVSAAGGVLRLRATSPVGLVAARRDLAVDGAVVVQPARVPVPCLPRRPGRTGSHGLPGPPVAGVGTEVLGLRPWRAGEPARAVSARATARHGRPLVLEREHERDGDPTLVVLVGAGSGPAWERALADGAALGADAAGAGRPPVLLGLPDSAPTGTRTGAADRRPRRGRTQVLDAFATADAAPPLDERALSAALALAGPGGTLVVVAPRTRRADTALSGAGRGDAGLPDVAGLAARARCTLLVLDGESRPGSAGTARHD